MRLRKLVVCFVALTRRRRHIRRVKRIVHTKRMGPRPPEKGRALEKLDWNDLVRYPRMRR
jgi:hypothetical protein